MTDRPFDYVDYLLNGTGEDPAFATAVPKEAILAIESEALPSVDLLARAIEETAQRPWSAMGSRAHAEAILEWLREQGGEG